MGKDTTYNKFCFLNEIPSFYIYICVYRMIKIEYPTMMPLARRIQKDTKRLDSDKLIGRMKK